MAVFLVASVADGSQSPGYKEIKFNVLARSSGVTKSGAPTERTVYETPKHSTVQVTIEHLDSLKAGLSLGLPCRASAMKEPLYLPPPEP